MPALKPYNPCCEACGEEDPELATEIRKQTMLRGGDVPMAVMMPLRPLNLCEKCRALLAGMIRWLGPALMEASPAVPGTNGAS